MTYARQNAASQSESPSLLKQDGTISEGALEEVSVFRYDDHRPYPPIAILYLHMPELEIAYAGTFRAFVGKQISLI